MKTFKKDEVADSFRRYVHNLYGDRHWTITRIIVQYAEDYGHHPGEILKLWKGDKTPSNRILKRMGLQKIAVVIKLTDEEVK